MPSRTRGPGWHRKYSRHRNFQGPWGPWALIFGAQTTLRHCRGLWATSVPSLCPVAIVVFWLEVVEESVFRRRRRRRRRKRRRLSRKRRISMPSSMLHSMTKKLIHVHRLETLYLCYGVKCQSGVIWGHWGQKVIFTKNAITRSCYIAWPYDSYRLISLSSSSYVMGSNVNLGSFGVTNVKRSFSLKML